MKKMLITTLFLLATLAWAEAQQPGTTPPSSQAPGASQSQRPMPGSPDQSPAPGDTQAGSQAPTATAPVTEGCLGGSDPNYTVTDKAGTTYKLNIPPNSDTSKLAQHVGEPVQVAGNVKDTSKAGNSSIDVKGIGAGTGTCPAGNSSGAQSPPKR